MCANGRTKNKYKEKWKINWKSRKTNSNQNSVTEGKEKSLRGNNALRIVAYLMAQRKLNVKLMKIVCTQVEQCELFMLEKVKIKEFRSSVINK